MKLIVNLTLVSAALLYGAFGMFEAMMLVIMLGVFINYVMEIK